MRHCDKCESCDWYNMGVIRYIGSNFDIVESVTVDYDRYGGGFMFIGYTMRQVSYEGKYCRK